MKTAVIAIVVLVQAFDFFLKYLNYRNRNAPLPENVRDVYDEETYKKQSAYAMENLKLGVVSGICMLAVTVTLLAFNVYSGLYYFIAGFTESAYLRVYFMFASAWLIALPVSLVFEAIGTFKIEAKYGFNKTSAKTFIADIVKSALLNGVLINLGLLSLFMMLHGILGNMVFIAFFFVLAGFIMIYIFFSSLFIRIFNKLTPMEEGSLKDKVVALCKEIGYPVKRIFVIDGSRRSTKANAFATGFGKGRTIALYDTLIEKFTEDEVLCVTAHELGHAKKRHILKMMPFFLIGFVMLLALAYFVVNSEAVALAFGFTEINPAFGMFIMMVIFSPIMLLFMIPLTAFMRRNEFEADSFEVKYVGKDPAISAMKKIGRVNYANLTPHPLVVKLTYSHPPIDQRIRAMEECKF